MISKEYLLSLIVSDSYYRFPQTTVTVCCLTLKGGFSVIGHSACIDSDHFNAETGKLIAKENAISQMWELEGYAQLRPQDC